MSCNRCRLWALLFFTAGILLSGCTSSIQEEEVFDAARISTVVAYEEDDIYSDYTKEAATEMHLDELTGEVTITQAGTYVLSGKLQGRIVVKAGKEDVVRLVLDGVSIISTERAPIDIQEAKKTVISLPEGNSNVISDTAGIIQSSDDEPDAAIFSKADLTFNGTGSLEVQGNDQHAIHGKDDIKFMEGSYRITAENDGIKCKDHLYLHDGDFVITAQGDGLQTTNTQEKGELIIENGAYQIDSGQDGIQASASVEIYGGTIHVTSGGGSVKEAAASSQLSPFFGFSDFDETDAVSTKGIKAESEVLIQAGALTISSLDDAIHSNAHVTITGGTLELYSDDDGIHADENLTIQNGIIQIKRSYEGLEGSTITLEGGEVHIVSSDDGVNAAGDDALSHQIIVHDGILEVDAYGDGIDSNGDIMMDGGMLVVMGSADGANGAMDYDGTFLIQGGTLVCSGSSGMAQMPSSSSTQPSVMIHLTSTQTAGTLLYLSDEEDHVILGVSPSKAYQNVVISSPDLQLNSSYRIYTGGSANEIQHALFQSAEGGALLGSITLNNAASVYGSGGMQGGGMPQGRGL